MSKETCIYIKKVLKRDQMILKTKDLFTHDCCGDFVLKYKNHIKRNMYIYVKKDLQKRPTDSGDKGFVETREFVLKCCGEFVVKYKNHIKIVLKKRHVYVSKKTYI